jgi:hypothetical protein
MKEVIAYCRHFQQRFKQVRLCREFLHMFSVSHVVLR